MPALRVQTTLALWFALVGVLACSTIGVLTYSLQANSIREAEFAHLELLRDANAEWIGRWFTEGRKDAVAWSRSAVVIQACAEAHRGEPFDREELASQLAGPSNAYGVRNLALVDARDGSVIASSQAGGTRRERLEAATLAALDSKAASASDITWCEHHQSWEVVFSAPVPAGPHTPSACLLVLFVDPQGLYDSLDLRGRLGETGEALAVNDRGVVQTPLKFRQNAVGKYRITAEPARRGAAGEKGRLAVDDYRPEPVMAAYGYIPEAQWGFVVKQDMAELNQPVRQLAREVAIVSCLVLVLAVLTGLIVARTFAHPAAQISQAAERISRGDFEVRATPSGAVELRTIAASMNRMLDALAVRARVGETLSQLYTAASSHAQLGPLLGEVLPRLLDSTRSQAGVIYLAKGPDEFERALAYGIPSERLPRRLKANPPDGLLARAVKAGSVSVIREVPDSNQLRIVTPAGEAQARSLLSIPIGRGEQALAIIGLASLHDYREEDLEIARSVSANLGQAIAAAQAGARTEDLAAELQAGNEELRKQAIELEAQRRRVEEANRLKSEFLSNMSHELRTPLNSVLALAQLMLARGTEKNPQQSAEYLRVIERNGQQLLALINDVLDLAKIESGHSEMSITDFEPGPVAESAVDTIRPLAQDKNLELALHVAPDVSRLRTDAGKLQQILVNLLSNAVKFTDRGRVQLEVRQVGTRRVRFAISDTGMGIAPADQTTIFEEFRQGDGSTTRRHRGTGLGLSISKKLAALLGGDLTVSSKVGQGSTFTLELPVRSATAATSTPPEPDSTGWGLPQIPGGRERPTVVVVEDDPDNRLAISAVLDELGVHHIEARDGVEAMSSIRAHRPALVLMDMHLPELDGLEVTRRIKQDPDLEGIRVVAVTARAAPDDRREILAAGCVDCLTKPLNLRQMADAVDRYLTPEETEHG